MVRVQVKLGWSVKNTDRVTSQPIFASGQKNRVQVKYFSGQNFLTHFAMSSLRWLFATIRPFNCYVSFIYKK